MSLLLRRFIGHKVAIRNHLSGVWVGVVDDIDDVGNVALTGRRLWHWTGAGDVSSVAITGITGDRISALTSVVVSAPHVEIHLCSDAAHASVMEAPVWTGR